ncbi:hypothetical protein F2P81_026259 [Scophthalmus maximus]|uniref:Uncharacterized protein n=1 Tax=Scophthalmus maximus TaxID=52904 RepID=A0A6A4RMW8_SCOMX|nr:hypothetical protein F2P81_026259 [Scophthalmus maximus]
MVTNDNKERDELPPRRVTAPLNESQTGTLTSSVYTVTLRLQHTVVQPPASAVFLSEHFAASRCATSISLSADRSPEPNDNQSLRRGGIDE